MVALRTDDPPAQSLSLAAGLALADAIDAAAPGLPILLKWPNDLLMEGLKLAGILLERRGERVVIGFGINLAAVPKAADGSATHLGGRFEPKVFAPLLAGAMSRILTLWRSAAPGDFATAWLARAHPIGSALSVHGVDAERVRGRFEGIDADGALRLRLDNGRVEIIRAGDITLD